MSIKKQQEATNLEEVGYEIPDDELDIGGTGEIDFHSAGYSNLDENMRIVLDVEKKNKEQQEMEKQINEVVGRANKCVVKEEKRPQNDLKIFLSFLLVAGVLIGFHVYSQINNERTIAILQQDLIKAQRDLKIVKNELLEVNGEKALKFKNENLPILNEFPILNGDDVEKEAQK
jgi:hypothetical protein